LEHNRWSSRKKGYEAQKTAVITELGGKCVRCGIDDRRVLEIDHLDPEAKLRPPHRMYSTPIRIKLWRQEMGNLQLLCANCHRIKTWEQSWS
jgi:5-methylcytosine-specific restriction endonuclease McrA